MSMTGSLMGYENNNEINQIKCKKSLKTLPIVTTNIVSSGGVGGGGTSIGALNLSTTTNITSSSSSNSCKIKNKKQKESCNRGHANGLWSVWYGILAVCLQAYVATRCAKRFVAYLSLPWTTEVQPPKFELHACIVLTGTGVLLLPILLAAAFLKLGNLANDGIKLGRDTNTCSRDSTSTLLSNNHENSGLASNLWKHGGPTAAFVHLCTAMCFLLPSLLMEARLIRAGFLPKDAIWQTDLDFIVQHRDRLVFVDFLNPQGNLTALKTISQSYGISSSSSPPIEQFEDNFDDFESPSHETNNPIISTTEKSIISTVIQNKNDEILNIDFTTSTKIPDTITTKIKTVTSTSSSMTRRVNANNKNIQNKNSRGKLKAKKYGQRIATTVESQRNNNNNNMTGHTLALSMNSLSDLDHPEQLNLEITDDDSYDYSEQTISLEYLNYAMALGVYSVRYPAVFWSCNKVLGTIFSIQLVINSVQSLIAYAGMSILYKIQVVGPHKVLQLIRQRRIYPTSSMESLTTNIQRIITNLFGDNSHLILNPYVTLALFILSTILVLFSSMVTYLYAYGRFASFLEQEKERSIIMAKERKINRSGWTYFTHCAALCVFLAIAICNAPLLYDYTVVYRGSLDGAILFCIISTVLHLFIWLILWFFLTIKRNWIFKVHVIISTTTLHSTRTVKLVTDVDLISCKKRNNNNNNNNNSYRNNNNNNHDDDDDDVDDNNDVNINEINHHHNNDVGDGDDDDIYNIDNDDGTSAPLLVVGDGKTYSIAEALPKKAIMNVIHRAVMEKRSRINQDGNVNRNEIDSNATDDEQIYWLRPKLRPSPAQSPNANGSSSTIDKSWLNKKLRQKVTFNDLPSTSNTRNKGKRRGTTEGGPEDDGDYATLRELPLITDADDSTSEENKLLECVNDDQVTYYASGNRDLQPSEDDPSPLLTPEPLPDPIVNELTALNTSNLPPPIIDDITSLSTSGSFVTTVISSTTTSTINSATAIAATATIANNVTATSNSFLPQQPTGNTPRCLRRGDSGMPHDELTPRSDSSNSETVVGVCQTTIVTGINYCDAGSSIGNSNSNNNSSSNSNSNSNTSNNSETSSGVHSNISNISQTSTVSNHRRATSVDDLAVVTNNNEIDYTNNNHWRSCSLQRGSQPPNMKNIDFVTSVSPSGLITSKTLNSQYAVRIKNNNNDNNIKNQQQQQQQQQLQSGCPAVIHENSNEATVVIRRKLSRPKQIETNNPNEFEPFSRSTNMRMTSFTENSDLRGISGIHSSSATLPHYPTQPIIPTYPNCSTMPLPHNGHNSNINGHNNSTNISTNGPTSISCGSVQQQYPTTIIHPQQQQQQQQNGHSIVQPINHTTLPSHHNGMRIIHSTINNNYIKRYPQNNNSLINTVNLQAQQNWSLSSGHHTFPQLLQNKIFSVPTGARQNDRDSANFSMASSGDSDICIQHH